MGNYKVEYTATVVNFIMNEVTSHRVYDKIDSYRGLLSSFPEIGPVYNPSYEAARPPLPCRFIPIPDTPFTIYYTVDNEQRKVVVFYIEYQRRNPTERFIAAMGEN